MKFIQCIPLLAIGGFGAAFQETPIKPIVSLEAPEARKSGNSHEISVKGTAACPNGVVVEIAVAPKARANSAEKSSSVIVKAVARSGKFAETLRLPAHFIPGGYTATARIKIEDQAGDQRKTIARMDDEGAILSTEATFRVGALADIETAAVRESQEILRHIELIDNLIEKSKEDSPTFPNSAGLFINLSEVYNRSSSSSAPTLFPSSRAILAPAAIRGMEILGKTPPPKRKINDSTTNPLDSKIPDVTRQAMATLAGEYLSLVAEETALVKTSLKTAHENALSEKQADIWTKRSSAAKKDRSTLTSLLTRSHITPAIESRKEIATDLASLLGEALDDLTKGWEEDVEGKSDDKKREETKTLEQKFDVRLDGILTRLGNNPTSK